MRALPDEKQKINKYSGLDVQSHLPAPIIDKIEGFAVVSRHLLESRLLDASIIRRYIEVCKHET